MLKKDKFFLVQRKKTLYNFSTFEARNKADENTPKNF